MSDIVLTWTVYSVQPMTDLNGVLCLALGELGGLSGAEERTQIETGQLRHVCQFLCNGLFAIPGKLIHFAETRVFRDTDSRFPLLKLFREQ